MGDNGFSGSKIKRSFEDFLVLLFPAVSLNGAEDTEAAENLPCKFYQYT